MALQVTTTVAKIPAYRIWTHQTAIGSTAVTVTVNEQTGLCQVIAPMPAGGGVSFAFPISTVAGVQQIIDALAAGYPNGVFPSA